jgi:hypothetical protein
VFVLLLKEREREEERTKEKTEEFPAIQKKNLLL